MNYPYSGSFRLVSPYGMRRDPFTGEQSWHGGIDLVGVDSKEIRAVCGGYVLRSRMVTDYSDRTWEWGNYVSVLGDDGMTVYYCHLASRAVEAGDRIEAGVVIGTEGSTGRSTGSHLHFEVRTGGYDTLSASEYLGIENVPGDIVGSGGVREIPGVHDWSRDAVKWAVDNGVMLGDRDGYGLGDPCTREQMCVFLYRMYRMMKID